MKKLALIALFLVTATAMAGTIVIQETDEVVGYDGGCQVYFRPGLGYYEVCQGVSPVFVGTEFSEAHFHRGFHFHHGFDGGHFPGHGSVHFHGGHR